MPLLGLKIRVNFRSGERPGGITTRLSNGRVVISDRNVVTDSTWQNTEKGIEIRLPKNQDVRRYENIPGIEVLIGADSIDAEVALLSPGSHYVVTNAAVLQESIRQKGIDLTATTPQIEGKSPRTWWNPATWVKTAEIIAAPASDPLEKQLFDLGVAGIRRVDPNPPLARDLADMWGIVFDDPEPKP